MSVASDGGPAFPSAEFSGGMSLRDWFAGQALAGLLSDPATDATQELFATAAYLQADAMLQKRNSPPSESEYKKLAISIVREAAEQAKLGKL